MRQTVLFIAIVCAFLVKAEWTYGEELPEIYEDIRPLGMGNAFTAIANDHSAIWTNPAGVARAKKAWARNSFAVFRFPNIIAGANAEGQSLYNGYSSSQDQNAQEILDSAEDIGDDPIWGRAAMFPVGLFSFGRRNGLPAAFGAYSNSVGSAVVDSNTSSQTHVSTISDVGAVFNLGWSNNTNRFNIGSQLRAIYRYAYQDTIPTSDLLNKGQMTDRFNEDANLVTGFGADIGMLFTVADFWFPTIGVAVYNLPVGCRAKYLNPHSKQRETICGTTYQGEFGNPNATSVLDPMDIRAGVSITPRLSRKMALRFALDVHHLGIASGSTYYGLTGVEASKMLHGGVELFFGNPLKPDSPLSLRAGANQGFVTFGATMKLGILVAEIASYGKDVSSEATPQEDRRFVGSLTFEF